MLKNTSQDNGEKRNKSNSIIIIIKYYSLSVEQVTKKNYDVSYSIVFVKGLASYHMFLLNFYELLRNSMIIVHVSCFFS